MRTSILYINCLLQRTLCKTCLCPLKPTFCNTLRADFTLSGVWVKIPKIKNLVHPNSIIFFCAFKRWLSYYDVPQLVLNQKINFNVISYQLYSSRDTKSTRCTVPIGALYGLSYPAIRAFTRYHFGLHFCSKTHNISAVLSPPPCKCPALSLLTTSRIKSSYLINRVYFVAKIPVSLSPNIFFYRHLLDLDWVDGKGYISSTRPSQSYQPFVTAYDYSNIKKIISAYFFVRI